MKFTEGYWLRSERSHELYAMDAYYVTKVPGGMRVVAPVKKVGNREDTLNLPTITIEFSSPAPNIISVRAWHYEAYDNSEARFEKTVSAQEVEVEIDEDQAVMRCGEILVRVDRRNWGYRFEHDGKVLTSCGFRNLGYMRWDKEVSSMFPGKEYLTELADPYMVNELSLSPGECVYGLGERFTAFVKNGQVVETWNEDGGTSSQISYKTIPFYMTNRGYGILVDHTGNVSFEVASEKVEYVGFSVPGEELRYDFIYGPTPKEILQNYTGLTGRPALPPAWSFGLWLSTSFTTNYDEATTSSFIEGMAEREIPLSVFHYDCFWMKEFQWCDFEWDDRIFPNVREMLQRQKASGLKVNVWINPYIAQGTPFFAEGVRNGYFLKRADGKGVKQIDWWQPGMALVDFTNPAAVTWYQNKLETLLDMGVDAFKTDFGERIPVNVVYHNGADPVSMHNYYTFLYAKCVFSLLERKRGKGEAVLFARSATAGSQQFPVHWGGDSSASYPSMAETLRGGLSLAVSGFAFWSHDIAGFEEMPSADLYKRWAAFGMLSTHSRLHGSTSYRVPWIFDDESSDVVRYFVHLKNRLMPYIYRMAVKGHVDGTPVMRPMVFDYPDDPAAAYLDMQYMFGDSLLVAPIFNDQGLGEFYLPEGTWTDYISGEALEGGRWYRRTYDYFSMPLYVKPDTLLAIGADPLRPDYEYARGLTLALYQLADGSTATCEVPDLTGVTVLTAEARREGRVIIVELSGIPEEVSILLKGISSIREIEGGTFELSGGEVLMQPGSTTIRITLA